MPIIEEPHDSDYEPVKDDKDSRAGSVTCSADFTLVKAMIRQGLDKIFSAHLFYQRVYSCHLHYFLADLNVGILPKGKNLIWKALPDLLLERGVQLTGWPETILFPTQKLKLDATRKSGQGIKDIGINGAHLLAETLAGQEGCIKGTEVNIAGKCSF